MLQLLTANVITLLRRNGIPKKNNPNCKNILSGVSFSFFVLILVLVKTRRTSALCLKGTVNSEDHFYLDVLRSV